MQEWVCGAWAARGMEENSGGLEDAEHRETRGKWRTPATPRCRVLWKIRRAYPRRTGGGQCLMLAESEQNRPIDCGAPAEVLKCALCFETMRCGFAENPFTLRTNPGTCHFHEPAATEPQRYTETPPRRPARAFRTHPSFARGIAADGLAPDRCCLVPQGTCSS